MGIVPNAKLKRRFGQTEGLDQRQVNEASGSYKMQDSTMADLSVVGHSSTHNIFQKLV